MQMERLDRAGLDFAVVDLAHLEALERLRMSAGQPAELGHAATVVGEPLELDDLDAFDGRRGTVRLGLKGALGGGSEVHLGLRSYDSGSTRRNRYCPYVLFFIGRAMRSTASAPM